MKMNDYIRFIISVVESHPGITGIDLSLAVMNRINPVKWETEEYLAALNHCLIEDKISAFSFKLNGIDNLKSIYFPKDTRYVS